MKKIFIVFMCLLCFSIPCFASSWYWIGASTNGTQYYIDNDSVRKNNHYAIVWVKISNPDGTSSIEQLFFNHYNKTYAVNRWADYASNGQVSNSGTPSYLNYESIIPDSMGENVYYAIWGY